MIQKKLQKNVVLLATGLLFALEPALQAQAADGGSRKSSSAPVVKVVNDSEDKEIIQIPEGAGSADAEARLVRLSMEFPDGKSGEAVVFLVREPKTGLSWWEYQWLDSKTPANYRPSLATFTRDYKLQLASERIIGFSLNADTLVILESSTRSDAFDDALGNVESTITANLRHPFGNPIRGLVEVPLRELLGRGFFVGSKPTAQWRPSTLAGVTKDGPNWIVSLEGPDGEHATVTLSATYKIVSATREGSSVWDEKK